MTNRREFLQAAAITGLPVLAGSSAINDAPRTNVPPRTDLYAFVVDERYAAARSLATDLAGADTIVYGIPEGDITQIWVREIGPAWRREPVAIAGLTARPALFCLEQLAFACGLRVVFHAEHVAYPEGQTEHTLLRGAEHARVSASDLRRAGLLWPARIAEAIVTHRKQPVRLRFGPSDAALEPTLPPGTQLLTSWVIANA